jgi:hypothetical protein
MILLVGAGGLEPSDPLMKSERIDPVATLRVASSPLIAVALVSHAGGLRVADIGAGVARTISISPSVEMSGSVSS